MNNHIIILPSTLINRLVELGEIYYEGKKRCWKGFRVVLDMDIK